MAGATLKSSFKTRSTVVGPVLLFLLLVRVVCGIFPPSAAAGIAGSAHDFTGRGIQDYRTGALGSIDPNGACSACHVAHGAKDVAGITPKLPSTYAAPYLLWPRDLADEANYFEQYDSDPIYLSSPALMCYDCHDNQNTAIELFIDPESTSWPAISIYGAPAIGDPQDIALGDFPGAQGSGNVGYYEMYDGSMPSNPSQTDITGGHFWQRPDAQLIGTPAVAQGEKLSCRLCHEPHDNSTQQVGGESQAMFRTQYWDGSAWKNFPAGNLAYGQSNGGLYSSYNTRAHSDETPDANNHGRNLCSACHSYSDQGTPVTMYGQQIPSPPSTVGDHNTSSVKACTDCHSHNRIAFSCDQCHGFPPLNTAAHNPVTNRNGQSYAGGAGAHQRHLDALGTADFRCEICHGPSPGSASWHNAGAGTVVQANVDIMGELSRWDPAGSLVTGYAGTASAVAVPSGYDFTALGGNDGASGGRCYGVACHGDPPNVSGALNWTDDMVDETTGAALSLDICRWCHDSTPATVDGGAILAPNVMGDGSTFGAEISGHGLSAASAYDSDGVGDALGSPGADKDCTVCHDARYGVNPTPPPANTPVKTHFDESYNSAEKRLRDTINGQPVSGTESACAACHQSAGAESGSQVSTHGNSEAGGYGRIEPDAFARQCAQCHEPHGLNWNGSVRNLFMVGRWLDGTPSGNRSGTPDAGEEAVVDTDNSLDFSAVDRSVVFTATNGNGSYDDGFDDGLHESICVVCHDDLVNNHNEFTSPELLGTGHNPVGTDCSICHGHDFDGAVATADGFMPSGCSGCHGNSADNTIWPDGPATAKTAYPDRAGRHQRHVLEVMNRLNVTLPAEGGWSDLPRTLLTMSQGDQQRICEYCHNDPAGVGGTGHYVQGYTKDDAPADVGGINPLWDTADPPSVPDADALYAPATYDEMDIYTGGSTCAAVDCHNNKTTAAPSLGWYDADAGDCTMCHTVGGGGANPNSGLHNLNDSVNGTVSHDDSFGVSYTCTECHQSPPTDAHINGAADNPETAVFSWNTSAMTLALNVLADDTDDNCTSTCHTDGGDWSRLWSTDADADHSVTTPGQSYCAVCHGEPGDFRTGVEHVSAAPHSCDTCHFITSDPQHRDGNIELNDNLDPGCTDPTDIQIGAAPPGVFCAGCHANDTEHTSPRSDGSYWPHDIRTGAGICVRGEHPSAACLNCHNAAQTPVRLIASVDFSAGDFSLSSHHIDESLALTQSQKERGCVACHYEAEAGASDGLIGLKHYNAAGANTDTETGQTYDVVNFDPADRAATMPAVTTFCQGCHGVYMETSQPFSLGGGGDTATPVARSWDGVSVAVKFDVDATGRFSPYDSNVYNVTPAFYVTKADSPHRRPDLNQRGIAGSGAWSDSGGADTGLQCMDCHNAHGSDVAVTRSWVVSGTGTSADGSTGGILVSASGRWAGWNYTPAASVTPGEYSAEADLCFDCHLGDETATDAKSYLDYGVTASITDYYSGTSGRWRTSDTWDTPSFSYKKPNAGGTAIQSSHWTGSLSTPAAHPVVDGSGMGQCTPCHDPHGVTPRTDTPYLRTTNGGLKYPLLKGNWLTSPYKEDRAGDITTSASTLARSWTGTGGTSPAPMPRETPDFRAGDDAMHYNNPPLVGGGYGTGISGSGAFGVGNASGHDGFFIDDNTWGVNSSNGVPYWDQSGNVLSVAYPSSGPLAGTYSDYAGICTVCHTSNDTGSSGWPTAGSGRASIRSIHSTVKGWEGNSSWNPFDPNWYTGFDGLVDQHLMDGGRMPDTPGDPSQAPHGTNSKDWPSVLSHSKIESAGNQLTQISSSATPKTNNNFGRYNWAAHFPDDDTGQAPAPGYHRFSCSKCHSPHSQALPRLMRTNCMETSNNNEAARQFRDYDQGINAPHTNTMACHGEDYHLPWNEVTPWDNAPATPASPMPTGGKAWETY